PGKTVAIDTATGCAATTMATASGVCVIAATKVDIGIGATLRATGPQPLLLLATGSISNAGTIDAASHRGGPAGPGANPQGCPSGTPPTLLNGSGGGGYGGTFATVGGDGGRSIGNGVDRGAKGVAATTVIAPAVLRGGCPGVKGASTTPGDGGAGGG